MSQGRRYKVINKVIDYLRHRKRNKYPNAGWIQAWGYLERNGSGGVTTLTKSDRHYLKVNYSIGYKGIIER